MMGTVYLICDDQPINNTILSRLITKVDPNCVVIETTSGAECLEIYVSMRDSKYKPKAIFLDQQMFGMTGIATARSLRDMSLRDEGLSFDGPIFLVTAEPNLQDFEKTKLFQQVIPKPLDLKLVTTILETLE
jgi:CheY-like chemotaxis protein